MAQHIVRRNASLIDDTQVTRILKNIEFDLVTRLAPINRSVNRLTRPIFVTLQLSFTFADLYMLKWLSRVWGLDPIIVVTFFNEQSTKSSRF